MITAFQSPRSAVYDLIVGRFIYDNASAPIEIDDRTLLHLRIVVMNKLRRGEGFMLSLPSEHGTGRRDLWLHPSIQCQFQFVGSRTPQVNVAWLEKLIESASSADGMRIVREP